MRCPDNGRMRITNVVAALACLVLALGAACSSSKDETSFSLAKADTARNEDPAVTADQLTPLVDGNTAFATDLYGVLSQRDGNLFFSPYSISVALAMTYAGAAGDTATEIEGCPALRPAPGPAPSRLQPSRPRAAGPEQGRDEGR